MKPKKNKIFCKDIERTKMLFETEKKAESFIKFNRDEIYNESGYFPKRSYYCLFCAGWHTTSLKIKQGPSHKEELFEQFKQKKEGKSKSSKKLDELSEEEKIETVENQITEFSTYEKDIFFNENINNLNNEIKKLSPSWDKEEIKNLRKKLQIMYIVRKKYKVNKKEFKMTEEEIEEWRLWVEERKS